MPDEGPSITGTLPLYSPGETLTANCSSFNSFPSASLNWYINGQVAPKRLLVEYPVTSSRLQLYTSTLGLRYLPPDKFHEKKVLLHFVYYIRLKVEKNLFTKSGDLKIKCTATIDPIYWKSNEESIQGFQERSYINFWNSGIVNNRSKANFSSNPSNNYLFSSVFQQLTNDLIYSPSVSTVTLYIINVWTSG